MRIPYEPVWHGPAVAPTHGQRRVRTFGICRMTWSGPSLPFENAGAALAGGLIEEAPVQLSGEGMDRASQFGVGLEF
jgi:hypothetical protein